jgi:hypothetical protein
MRSAFSLPALAGCLLVWCVLAWSPAFAAGDEEILVAIEHRALDAIVRKDVKTLAAIFDEGWTEMDSSGAVTGKAAYLQALSSGDYVATSVTPGPMTARLFGDTAVVQGGNEETSRFKGQDTSGKYIWTDVFVKRKGRWRLVATQTVKLGG